MQELFGLMLEEADSIHIWDHQQFVQADLMGGTKKMTASN